MKLWWEKAYPYVAGLICVLILYVMNLQGRMPWSESFGGLIQVSVTLSGSLIGFLATAMAVLVAILDRPVMQQMKQFGLFGRIIRYFQETILVLILAVILGGITLVPRFDHDCFPTLFIINIGLFIVGLVASYRLVSVFGQILKRA